MAEDLLKGVAERLRVTDGRREMVIRELHAHLDDSRRDLELSGRSTDDAARESIRRFGDPVEVAAMLSEVHRRRLPRVKMVAAVTFALAGLSAAFGAAGTFASAPHHSGNHTHHAVTASALRHHDRRR